MDAKVQRLVSVVKMATVLEAFTTEEQRFVVRFFVGGGGKRNQCKGYSYRNVSCLGWEVLVA
jgi:hypothetical protein